MNKDSKGFSLVEIILVIFLIVAVGGVGYYVWNENQTTTKSNVSGNSKSVAETDQAPEVKSSSDLKEAEIYLDQTDIDKQLDTSEIDTALE